VTNSLRSDETSDSPVNCATINVLREKAGMPPRPPFGGGGPSAGASQEGCAATVASIKHDTFFGKKMGTAVRQYLEMRFETAGDTSPAKPKEILEALKVGGFVFETKDDNVAIISLRNMLRKSSAMFQKLPNGTYGLVSWYPGAKKPKAQAADEVDESAIGIDETDDAKLELEAPQVKVAS
jgi:hypothetical protein